MNARGIILKSITIALLVNSGMAQGGNETIVYSFSRPLTTTPWNYAFAVPTLDSTEGVLLSVEIRVATSFVGSYRVENLGPNTQHTGATLLASTDLRGSYSGGTALYNATGSSSVTIPPLEAFDGTVDFAGTSGFTSPNFTDSDGGSLTLGPGDAFFAAHLGAAYVVYSGSSQGAIFADGISFAIQADVQSGIDLTVTYTYRRIDCNSNTVPDAEDISSGSSYDCDGNDFPDDCQHDHNGDDLPDSCDPQCLAPGPDSDGDGVLDLCDTIPDCDSNHIPDVFEVDRNQNGIKDTCEFSGDCNLNGLPDALDLAVGISDDFDQNDVPDECQSTSLGFFQDCLCQPFTGCSALSNSSGGSAELAVVGSCRVSDDQFALQVSHLPPNRPALFFQGALGTPTLVGLGFRCITSPMSRLGIVPTDAGGVARFDVHLGQLVGVGAIRAWDSRAFQVAFRDAGPDGPSIQFSDTVHLRFCP